ncbi:hypothetical protein [Georgenia sp. AZ-5]|uniref:hypothetical protein n=1 Tax=Georgenia sp. AZ-5 TaxID=3367526 RepID=UPI00375537B8
MRALRGVVAAAAAVLVLAGCSQSDPEPAGETTGSPAAEETGKAAEEVTAEVFGSEADAEPLAEGDGVVTDGPRQTPVRVEVQAVEATPESTVVTFTLYGTTEEEQSLPLDAFNSTRMLMMDIRDVSIVDEGDETRYAPYLGYESGGTVAEAQFCMCSHAPKTVSAEGVLLYATYPPLAEGSETVTLEIPGFEPIEGLPVTR